MMTRGNVQVNPEGGPPTGQLSLFTKQVDVIKKEKWGWTQMKELQKRNNQRECVVLE